MLLIMHAFRYSTILFNDVKGVIIIESENKYLSVTEASEILGLQRARTGVLCRAGRFPGAIKIGNSWIIPREAVLNHKPLPPGVKAKKAKLAAEKAAILEAEKVTREE
jgi:predicted DNA-binding transcriptional regulator AlpA